MSKAKFTNHLGLGFGLIFLHRISNLGQLQQGLLNQQFLQQALEYLQ